MKKLPISVCLIAGNEGHRIRPALESVAGWATEIILVINADVHDETEPIAVEFGAKVFREPWKGFIGQKNSAAEKCEEPWVLNLDADEVISPQLQTEIATVLNRPHPIFTAYTFPRCTLYCGRWIRHGDWYPDRVLRLWRRGAARWTGEEPHAYLEVTGEIGRLHADLLHFSNENIARHIAKIIPYQSGFLARRLAEGWSPGILELALRPAWRFFRAYFLRLGFLDGWQGLYIAGLSAFSTLTRYALIREAQMKSKHEY